MNELSIFNSLLDNVLADATPGVYYRTAAATPRVDVMEEKDAYVLEMELPGRSEKDVNIELDHDTLKVASIQEDKKEAEDKKTKYILKERRYSSFERRFTLPQDVDAETISANFKNGILTIQMQKKAVEAPRKIMIEAC